MLKNFIQLLIILGIVLSKARTQHYDEKSIEQQLEELKENHLIQADVNISSFRKWQSENAGEMRQSSGDRNPFFQWLSFLLGVTTTTPAPPQTPPTECLLCQCGKSNKNKIVGGTETGVNQYPWMAMLLYSNRFYCGATLINDRYVLTASHCVNGFNPTRITVRLLEHDRTSASESETITKKVERIIKHPRYSQNNFDNDIALIKLAEPVKFEGLLNPACLAVPQKSFSGSDGIVTGWGTLKEGGDVSQTLQHVTVPIISNKECRMTGYSERRITDNMLCAGFSSGGKDSCQGDSGGPLHFVDDESKVHQIVGVVSWGEGCAKENYPGVYARVNRYLSWIRNNTVDACYCDSGLVGAVGVSTSTELPSTSTGEEQGVGSSDDSF